MKIKVITRDPNAFQKRKQQDIERSNFNPLPELHPFERAREYIRALNAVKLERVFSRPFLHALDGHRDTVYSMAKHPSQLSLFASGSGDGEVRMWNIATKQCLHVIKNAHQDGFVKGIGINSKGQVISAGMDGFIKIWDVYSPTWIPQVDGLGEFEDECGDLESALNRLENDTIEDDNNPADDDDVLRFSTDKKPSVKRNAVSLQKRKFVNKKEADILFDQYQVDSHRYGAPIRQSDCVLSNNGQPIATWTEKAPFTSLTLKWDNGVCTGQTFATTSTERINLWDYDRSEALCSLKWEERSPDSYTFASFNPVESDILGAVASDRSFAFFDMRMSVPLRKLVMEMNTNSLAWNPIEPFVFTIANENHNLYTYDMRNLKRALHVHIGHTSAVLDVDFSPTGQEFVSGSYDSTVRIFPIGGLHSREVYHTKRMQRVFNVKYSSDSHYLLSGSEDAIIRIWKSNASGTPGIVHPRKQTKLNYNKKLINRWKHMPEIGSIHNRRRVPRKVYYVKLQKNMIMESAKRKMANVRANTKLGEEKRELKAREKSIVSEIE